MTIEVSAFAWAPPFAQGLVRDLRVRWALEEVGLPYVERAIKLGEHTAPDYLAVQPFGQIPAYQEDGLTLFESGAIVLHIAERSEVLLPLDPKKRARTKTWMFAALNSVEPPIMFLNYLQMVGGTEAAVLAKPITEWAQLRLRGLATQLEAREYLEDQFTAGDLLMTTVLRILRTTDLLSTLPALVAYQARCEARPAFQKALRDHMATFQINQPVPSQSGTQA